MASTQTEPSPRLETFVVSEDVRPEATGLLTVVGMFHDSIGVPRLPIVMLRLAAVSMFRGLRGLDSFEFRISAGPKGKRVHDSGLIKVSKPMDEDGHTVLHRFQPFKIDDAGTYVFTVMLRTEKGGLSFVKTLHVKNAEAADLGPSAQGEKT